MRANERFNDKVRETWLWFMQNGFNGLYGDIDAYVSHLEEAARADRRRWEHEPAPDGGQPVCDNTDMQGRKQVVLRHLQSKINWLKNSFYIRNNTLIYKK